MTKIVYSKNVLKAIGHANSKKDKDYDLICCAISTIMYTCPVWFKKKEIDFVVNKSKTSISIKLISPYTKENVNKLNLAYQQLKVLAKKYPKYIEIENKLEN